LSKSALITGITGQDGSYLAEFLLGKGYEVHGMVRRTSTRGTERIAHLLRRKDLTLHSGDMTDGQSLKRVLAESKPDEVYNLAAQSQVHVSFGQPHVTREINYHGVIRLTDELMEQFPDAKFYQASTSEMFGNADPPQSEKTPLNPVSPYARAKTDAHKYLQGIRDRLFTSSGILFNHESPRRGDEFVTKKIIQGLANIKKGKQSVLHLGNLESKRDWGYAPDYVEAMWKILQQDKPDDYVIATGQTHSIQEFLDKAVELIGIEHPERHIEINPDLFRPREVNVLLGDATKARKELNWKPKTDFDGLVRIMVREEMK
jgi:GDPmannose 4,6-dehydratase